MDKMKKSGGVQPQLAVISRILWKSWTNKNITSCIDTIDQRSRWTDQTAIADTALCSVILSQI